MRRTAPPFFALVVPLALGSAACRDRGSSPEGDTDGSDTDTDTSESGDDGDNPALRCEEDRLGPPMLRRLTRAELEATIRHVFPEIAGQWSGVALGPDPVSSHGFSNDAETLVVGNQTAAEILETAQDVATLVTTDGTLATVLPCASNSPDLACATQLVEQRGAALFRRPLTDEEVSRYVEHYDSIAARSDFATGLRWTLVAMMQSPQAVYRSELGQREGEGYRLDAYEIASALAYDFAGQPPDDALLARAAAGELDDPQARIEEARRLLSTDAGVQILRRFFREWSGYGQIAATVRGDDPAFEDVRDSMELETQTFIEQVVYADEGGVQELLTAPYTMIDRDLAAFYGYGEPGDVFTRVERPPEWGVGLLSQASLLAANAHAEASSPTLRGLLVYERLLCHERLSPPADVPAITPPAPGSQTTRQRYEEAHAAEGACNACHRFFDPIGFAFEHFDNVGRYRADENGLPIDASGEMFVELQDDPVLFDGLTGLAQAAADTPEVTDCVSGLMISYTFGGAGGEVCLAEGARDALQAEEIGLFEYVVQLAGARHFVERRTP